MFLYKLTYCGIFTNRTGLFATWSGIFMNWTVILQTRPVFLQPGPVFLWTGRSFYEPDRSFCDLGRYFYEPDGHFMNRNGLFRIIDSIRDMVIHWNSYWFKKIIKKEEFIALWLILLHWMSGSWNAGPVFKKTSPVQKMTVPVRKKTGPFCKKTEMSKVSYSNTDNEAIFGLWPKDWML